MATRTREVCVDVDRAERIQRRRGMSRHPLSRRSKLGFPRCPLSNCRHSSLSRCYPSPRRRTADEDDPWIFIPVSGKTRFQLSISCDLSDATATRVGNPQKKNCDEGWGHDMIPPPSCDDKTFYLNLPTMQM